MSYGVLEVGVIQAIVVEKSKTVIFLCDCFTAEVLKGGVYSSREKMGERFVKSDTLADYHPLKGLSHIFFKLKKK